MADECRRHESDSNSAGSGTPRRSRGGKGSAGLTILKSILQAACATAVAAAFAVVIAHAAVPAGAPSPGIGRWRDASLDDYRQHLVALSALVQNCAKGRNFAHCDPNQVGPDDLLQAADSSHGDRRLVRYGWLRVLLAKAEDPDEPGPKTTAGSPNNPRETAVLFVRPTTSQMLQDALQRLAGDLNQINGGPAPAPSHAQERDTMKQVLAGSEFRNLEGQTVRDSMLERFGDWLNRVFDRASRLTARSAWVGRFLVWGFVLGVCVVLTWLLLRMERRWRVRLIPEMDRPAAGAASARDWQLWLEDARRSAATGHWREAIHFMYWASISRLESKRLWPADRARTPREYLALVAPEDARKAGLAELTGSFERTWYGGRSAGEREYRNAERLASTLIGSSGVGSGSFSATETPTAEGGAQ